MSVTVVTVVTAITFLIVCGDQLLSSHHTVTRNGFTAADEGGGQGRTANLLVPMIRRKELVYTAQHSGTCVYLSSITVCITEYYVRVCHRVCITCDSPC